MTTHDDHDDIPQLRRPEDMPPVTDQASLAHAWRALMGELGFASPQLWLLFLDGDRLRNLLKVEDVPLDPTDRELAGVRSLLEPVADRPRSCAFLYARPGGPGRTPGDLAWARGLTGVFGAAGWPVHLANDVELRVAAPDDLAQAG
ncbi:MAG TPA: hypothetical protein VNT31_08765 [Nocardioides sp.]|nr:hypothetical protein [Nocardioides sp.]